MKSVFFSSSEWIVTRILIDSIVVNKIFSLLLHKKLLFKKIIIIIIIIVIIIIITMTVYGTC